MAYKVFTNGSVLNASEINDNLMRQSVMVFSNAAARTAAITSPVEGMLTWLEDVNRYETYNGTAWVQLITPGAWTSWTPTFTNITVGNGTVNARYARIGKTVIGYVEFILGSTSSVGSLGRFALPLTNRIQWINTHVSMIQSGIVFHGNSFVSGTEIYPLALSTTGTYAAGVGMTATIPFTWNNGSTLSVNFTYEEV